MQAPYLEQSPLSLKLSRSSSILWGHDQAHCLLEASLTTRELPSAQFLQCLYQVVSFGPCLPDMPTIDLFSKAEFFKGIC